MNSTRSTTRAGWPSDSKNRYEEAFLYLFIYTASNKEANELHVEYHLHGQAGLNMQT
jgi:hypothetical protein